jgi:DNA polymerase-3 subunit alpha
VTDSFVHLHAHTEYSMLDGAAKVRALLAKTVALGQPAIASTDHGNVFSHYEMWKVAGELRETGAAIKPILGCEMYVAPASRFDKKKIYFGAGGKKAAKKGADDLKDVSGDGCYTHMTMLAGNAQGLRAMFELTSRASKEGAYPVNKPRIDADLVAECLDNWPGAVLIGTTGCPSGAVQTRLRLGQREEAEKEVGIWRDILGPENYFLELMDHGNSFEAAARGPLMELATRMGLPLLATNDSHYVEADQAEMHDALLCVQMGRKLHETDRMKFDGAGYHLRDAAEMRRLFAELPAACDNTLAIAERIAVDAYDEVFLPRTDLLPKYPVPEGHTEATYLRELAMDGLRERYPDPAGPEGVTQEAWDRVPGYELPVLEKADYPGYMLTVWDFVSHARGRKIRVGPGRGSAAGSCTSYALGITTVPTLEHGLLFERFVNPERVSPPDVDVDFPEEWHGYMFKYLEQRWGINNVCRIQTLGTIKAKAAIKDACRVLDLPFRLGEAMTKLFPKDISGFGADLSCVVDPEHKRYADAEEIRAFLNSDQTERGNTGRKPAPPAEGDDRPRNAAWQIYDLACELEGLIRSTGVHACGIVVAGQSLMGLIPLVWSEKYGQWVSGFPNAEVLEPMGLLKVDILALKNLDVITEGVRQIADRHGVDPDEVEKSLVALDDPDTYAELRSGHTVGLFQVESAGMSKLLAQMRADRFNDISAGLALYRPGPMSADAHTDYALRKTGRQKIKPIHPELEKDLRPVLADTYGVFAYQEEIMKAAQVVAGYSLGQADILRKIMGKKKPEQLAKAKPPFFAGMQSKGFSEEAAQALWDVFEPFSAYAFNIAHTVSYGHITYATAWLKTHYPAEFMAAMLTRAEKPEDKAVLLAECRRMGITVLVPDVNESGRSFTPVDDRTLRFGLDTVNGLGSKAIPGIISGRAAGPYTSFADFLNRIPVETCDKKAMAALIRGGAFDSLGHTRRSLLEPLPDREDQVFELDKDGKRKKKPMAPYEMGTTTQKSARKAEADGQFDLFSAAKEIELITVEIPDVPEWDKGYRLQLEREALGLYVSGHPLDDLEPVLAGNRTMTIAELVAAIAVEEDGEDGYRVADPSIKGAVLAGQIVSVNKWIANTSGKPCAKIVLADLDSQVEIMAFSRALGEIGHALIPDAKIRIKVSLWERDEGEPASICVDDVAELDMDLTDAVTAPRMAGAPLPVRVVTGPEQWAPELAAELRRVILNHPGERPLHFTIGSQKWAPEGWTVTPDVEFLTEMKELLGRNAIRV